MKILILTGIFPPDIGGPATQLDALSRELIKNSYSVQILTFGQSDKAVYPYLVKRVSKKWPYFLRGLIYLIDALALAFDSDILYAQDLYSAGLTGLIIKKVLRKPLITRFVGDSAWETAVNRHWTNDDILTFQEKKYPWKIEWRKKIRKSILVNSDKVIVASYFLEQLAQKIGLAREKIKVIYNSIDFLEINGSFDKEELKQKWGLRGLVLLTVARLTPWKGVDMLIEIMPELLKKYSRINLVVVGQGEELVKLQELAKSLDLEKSVFFQGKLNRQQTVEHLKMADLFLLNTNYEGMSHTLLEAMKLGLPIITTFSGGNPETIVNGRTGLLVKYGDRIGWLKAISLILDNSDLAEKLAAEAKIDLKRFSWTKLVQETMEVFRNLGTYEVKN